MLDYLQKLFGSGETFLVHLTLKGGGFYRGRGLIAVDAVGIVIDVQHPFEHNAIAVPWTSIGDLKVEITG
jgi:hypothetical protein